MDSQRNSTRQSKKIYSQAFLNYSKTEQQKEHTQTTMKAVSFQYQNQVKTQQQKGTIG